MPIAAWLDEESLRLTAPSTNACPENISSWLLHAPSPPSSVKRGSKRSRHSIEHLNDSMSSRDSSPSKRRRVEELGRTACAIEDIEDTPRAKSNSAIELPSPSSFTSSHTSHSSLSRRSRSPKKKAALRKMANLSLLPNPVVMRSIDDATAALPHEVETVVLRLKRIGRGLGIISHSAKVSLSAHPCSSC